MIAALYVYSAGMLTVGFAVWLPDHGWMLTDRSRAVVAFFAGLLWPLVVIAAVVVWLRGRRG